MADALAHVLRVFESDTVPHEKGSVDPMRDFEDVEIELILSDLVVVEKRMERVDKDRKKTQESGAGSGVRAAGALQSRAGSGPASARAGVDARGREDDPRLPVSFAEADAVRAESRRRGRRQVAAKSRKKYRKRPAGRARRTPR